MTLCKQGVDNTTYIYLLTDNEVESFGGYDNKHQHLSKNVNISQCILEDRMHLTHAHLLDYACNLLHMEETDAIKMESSV